MSHAFLIFPLLPSDRHTKFKVSVSPSLPDSEQNAMLCHTNINRRGCVENRPCSCEFVLSERQSCSRCRAETVKVNREMLTERETSVSGGNGRKGLGSCQSNMSGWWMKK